MAATFPGGVKVFTTKQAGDQIASAHINDLQDEVVAVETELRKTTGSVVSHGSLAGLSNNDHPQYLLSASTNYPRADGWIPVSATWTYASATTITVPSGATNIYSVGMGIRLTANSVVKQAYITKVENTLLTVAGDALTNYTFSAISYAPNPATAIGFPQWFNYTPIWSATGGTPDLGNGTIVGKFSIIGTNIHYLGKLQFGSTTSAGTTTNWKFSIPIIITDVYNYLGQAFIYDVSGGGATYMRTVSIDKYQDANNLYLFLPMNDGSPKLYISYNDPFTFGTSDLIAWDIWYVV